MKTTALIVFCIVTGLLFARGCCCDCQEELTGPCREWSTTGITPLKGVWKGTDPRIWFNIYHDEDLGMLLREIKNPTTIQPHYALQVSPDGSFYGMHGDVGGFNCPNDGFCRSGHFVSEDTAVGEVYIMPNCSIDESFIFTAAFDPNEEPPIYDWPCQDWPATGVVPQMGLWRSGGGEVNFSV